MSSLLILGDTSGSVLLQAPAVAGSGTVTLPTTGGTVLTTASTGVCKAWVNYNGVAQTISGSYNVSSVTYSSTGTYVVNFTTAMSNVNYATTASASIYTSNSDYKTIVALGDTGNNYNQYSTTGVGLTVTSQANNARVNPYILCCIVMSS
jgi:hypothetical protein